MVQIGLTKELYSFTYYCLRPALEWANLGDFQRNDIIFWVKTARMAGKSSRALNNIEIYLKINEQMS